MTDPSGWAGLSNTLVAAAIATFAAAMLAYAAEALSARDLDTESSPPREQRREAEPPLIRRVPAAA